MRVKVNGTSYEFDKKLNLEQILKELDLPDEQGIAVAVNFTVVSRPNFASTYLNDGDSLEIIHATAGG
ncbi:MAG: sulfur carrier protein ThiS [bacterium]